MNPWLTCLLVIVCILPVSPFLLFLLGMLGVRPVKRFLAGHSRYSRCWMGLHRWSMPGGWCERCGLCDTFFGGHADCKGGACRYWLQQRG